MYMSDTCDVTPQVLREKQNRQTTVCMSDAMKFNYASKAITYNIDPHLHFLNSSHKSTKSKTLPQPTDTFVLIIILRTDKNAHSRYADWCKSYK